MGFGRAGEIPAGSSGDLRPYCGLDRRRIPLPRAQLVGEPGVSIIGELVKASPPTRVRHAPIGGDPAFPLDPSESGGHVRSGYSFEDYQSLLEPIGFEVDTFQGLGGPVRQAFNRRIKELQAQYGAAAGVPLFMLSLPCLWFENRTQEKRVPFSIYVRAVKPPAPSTAEPYAG